MYILHNEANPTLEVMPRNWYKRRNAKGIEDIILEITIPNYKEEHNHFCDMFVTYANAPSKKYISRVVWNEIKKYWTVDGMFVAVRVL